MKKTKDQNEDSFDDEVTSSPLESHTTLEAP